MRWWWWWEYGWGGVIRRVGVEIGGLGQGKDLGLKKRLIGGSKGPLLTSITSSYPSPESNAPLYCHPHTTSHHYSSNPPQSLPPTYLTSWLMLTLNLLSTHTPPKPKSTSCPNSTPNPYHTHTFSPPSYPHPYPNTTSLQLTHTHLLPPPQPINLHSIHISTPAL